MKRVVSVSLGSPARDAEITIEVLGERVTIARIGTNGDLRTARRLLEELDGNVDAIGLGGLNLWLYAGKRRYAVRQAHWLIEHVRRTPVVDGSGVKAFIERQLPSVLRAVQPNLPRGAPALLVSAVDRPFLYDALKTEGFDVILGDLVFALGMPFPTRSFRLIEILARLVVPVVAQLPIHRVYPVGEKQTQIVKGYATRLMEQAAVIAGDFHYIRRYIPDSLASKVLITNTVTHEDRRLLAQRGPVWLITTSPNFQGRSFATNVLEALIVAFAGKPVAEMTAADYERVATALQLRPSIEELG